MTTLTKIFVTPTIEYCKNLEKNQDLFDAVEETFNLSTGKKEAVRGLLNVSTEVTACSAYSQGELIGRRKGLITGLACGLAMAGGLWLMSKCSTKEKEDK